MVSAGQKRLIQRILNVFETGVPDGRYDALVIYADGVNNTRQITYGRSQTTEQGNLQKLIGLYCENAGKYAEELSPYISKIGEFPLCDDKIFKDLLISAGKNDPIMKKSQDSFFDDVYWRPAEKWFATNGFNLPLSMLVIYDSYIHSGRIRDDIRKTFLEVPPAKGGDEKAWTKAYVQARHHWLQTRQLGVLRQTVYRTQTMLNEINRGNWNLDKLPINANGVNVD